MMPQNALAAAANADWQGFGADLGRGDSGGTREV
jgi:hypothetical protein